MFHSAVEMSQLAPFTDAATAIDRTNLANTFISYYTYGAAIALALDLSLREQSNGKVSLDDYMRAMWQAHGKPGGPQPGLVGKPYTLKDARDRLAEVSGDRAFADRFFGKYIEGHDVPDYEQLLARAGIVFRKREPGRAWLGNVSLDANGQGVQSPRLEQPGHRGGIRSGRRDQQRGWKAAGGRRDDPEHHQRAQAGRSRGDWLHAS